MAYKQSLISKRRRRRRSSLSRFIKTPPISVLLLVALLRFKLATSDELAYVDPTFDCPATTTCPHLCVASLDDCPPEMMCPEGEILCADGSCWSGKEVAALLDCLNNNTNSTSVAPLCPNSCAPIPCARLITTYNVCTSILEVNGDIYDRATSCQESNSTTSSQADDMESGHWTWTGPAYIVVYVWVSVVTVGIILWCWYNHRWSPTPGSTKLLQMRTETHIANDPDAQMAFLYQTGYRQHHPVGFLLYAMTLITFFGWYGLLSYLTYVTYQDYSEQQILHALRTFCAVFNIGFFWNLTLYWPYSIETLFYRRVPLGEANQVTVHFYHDDAPTNRQTSIFKATMTDASLKPDEPNAEKSTNTSSLPSSTTFPQTSWIPTVMTNTLNRLSFYVSKALMLIFAEKSIHSTLDDDDESNKLTPPTSQQQFKVEYCPVHTNPDDGSRYFVFLFRRYNYDKKQQMFVAGEFSIGKTFAEMKPRRIQNLDDFSRRYAVDQSKTRKELAEEESSSRGFRRSTKSSGSSNRTTIGSKEDNTEQSTMTLTVEEATGLSAAEVLHRRLIVGPNVIEMTKPALWNVFRQEISKPFYLYQFHILWVWGILVYWYMMLATCGVILISACTISWFRYRSAGVLYEVSHVEGTRTVLRDQDFVTLDQAEMVPGDIVQLEPGTIHSDMVLLTGEVIVDESGLTGEATPQAKLRIDLLSEEVYDRALHTRQTLSAGTKILETHQSIGLVTQTASFTRKGELLREVIAFRRHKAQYEKDLLYAMLFLFGYCAVVWSVVYFQSTSEKVFAWLIALVTVTNALPPLLPISFTVPLGYSFGRLSQQNVVCSNSDAVLMSGEVTKIFFDKTGTLTRQGLEYTGCRSVERSKFVESMSSTIAIAMASCHTLVLSSEDGSLIGNPVDRAMFAASGSSMPELGSVGASLRKQVVAQADGTKLEILRRFDFDHYLMTQSVVLRLEDGSLMAFAKGSGEAIRDTCRVETVPDDFDGSLEDSARQGVYQIAVAFKRLPSGTNIFVLTREQIEEDMTFAGKLSFANKLREESPGVISDLVQANVQPVMLTGDSLFAGINVARETGIIDQKACVTLGVIEDVGLEVTWLSESGENGGTPTLEQLEKGGGSSILAMTGEAWRFVLKSQPSYATALAAYIRVVGRCTPHDKVSIVDTFVGLGDMTMMVGDGGNDCGALRAAHVGLALSDGDASLVAPFTSLDKDITSVITVLKEGRAALHSTLAVYRYIVNYGQITSYCQVITYWMKVTMTDWQWVFVDGIYTILFSLTLPRSKPANKLNPPPTPSLLSPQTVLSIVGAVILNYAVTGWALGALSNKDWYQCRKWSAEDHRHANTLNLADNYESEVVFLMVLAQCIIAAVISSFGYEFRQPGYRNYLFVMIALGAAAIHVYITLVPSPLSCLFRVNCSNEDLVRGINNKELQPIGNFYNTTVMPVEFRFELLAIMFANFVVVAGYDYFGINGIRKRMDKKTKGQYSLVAKEGPVKEDK